MKRILVLLVLSCFLPSYTIEQQPTESHLNNLIIILDQFELEKIDTHKFVMLANLANALKQSNRIIPNIE